MSHIASLNPAMQAAVDTAEGVKQAAEFGATQAAVKAAEIAFYRSALAAAKANGCGYHQFVVALMELGTGGS